MALFSGCTKEESGKSVMSINAAGEYFVNNEAELIVSLSEAAETAVNYVIKASGEVPGENLEFNGTEVIPAGTTVVAVPVKVNPDGMEDGEYKAVFTLYSAVGARLSPEKKSVTILLNVISAE